ncbi:uncharacterized protein LOC129956619 [Argiope bruennichi]|uniref:uncharacterized protein LOC129956619 n=1 Tax=Argiope bruennichi TaxID=94029 RepID=UPI0024942ACB|nr:uncharacterized protein LOC129956619 [Argiope bruennichi]
MVGGAVGARSPINIVWAKKNRSPFSERQMLTNQNQTLSHFDTFFTIKRVSDSKDTFHSVSPFLVQKAIVVGDVAGIRKLRSGDLLIEVNSKKQAQQITKLKALATIPATVSPHSSLNYSKGVITCGELYNVSLEEISKGFQQQGVTHVRRITIRRDGQLINTKHLILTFHSPKLPEFVNAGYLKLPVRAYIPNPLRCFQCQRFGHSIANCRGTVTCARCAEKGHESQECTAPEKCVNCGEDHASFSRLCKRWTLEKQITTLKFKENITYPEARRKILAQTPTPGLTYASVVQKQFCVNCSCPNCVKSATHTKTLEKSTDSETEHSTNNEIELSKLDKPKRNKTKSGKHLKLQLSKRGLSPQDIRTKLRKSTLRNSVSLGLANQGAVHKDLTSIFGGTSKNVDLIALHPSEEDEELKMSCDASQLLNTVPNPLLEAKVT